MVDQSTALDSATTARESIYRSRSHSRSSTTSSRNQGYGALDMLEKAPSSRASVSTVSTAEDGENGNGGANGNSQATSSASLERNPTYVKEFWVFRMRPADDDEPRDWWFASTAIPLLAATMGPAANVMSIAALVTSWRQNYDPEAIGIDDSAIGFPDPDWCVNLNVASLVCGFVGNLFLLFNFTRRIRYIIALPVTVILWFFATSILTAITISMNTYFPPIEPNQLYSQGFWHAVIAAVLYMLCSLLLMVNMLGYFLGHYPQHFDLSDEQRNLILQTMMFFIWLAGGAAVFARVCDWQYVDALYFCDVTILTVGFGDFFSTNDTGRGLVFPFSVGGIVILGLVVSSIRTFAQELGHDKVVKRHIENRRSRTMERSITVASEGPRNTDFEKVLEEGGLRPAISTPFDVRRRSIAFSPRAEKAKTGKSPKSAVSSSSPESHGTWSLRSPLSPISPLSPLKSPMSWASSVTDRLEKSRHRSVSITAHRLKKLAGRNRRLLVLREERDRFNAMREIQLGTKRFKQYFALSMSVVAFGVLWCVGAVAFWHAEAEIQGLTYFQALYFCYVSLLTIGYGDLSPKSNAGKPFFIIWSLVAVPTMTILISDMGDTVVASYKRGTFTLADWTVLPKQGFHEFLAKYPKLTDWLTNWVQARQEKKRIEDGFRTGPEEPETGDELPTLEDLAHEDALDEQALARKLTVAIRRTADDLKAGNHRRYTYEEWVEYTRLIRFTQYSSDRCTRLDREEVDEGIVEWDWIGEDSPMMADQSEAEWVLDRLCESLDRYMKRNVSGHDHKKASRIAERDEHEEEESEGVTRRSRSRWHGNDDGDEYSKAAGRASEEATQSSRTAVRAESDQASRSRTRAGRSFSAPKVSSMAALRLKQR